MKKYEFRVCAIIISIATLFGIISAQAQEQEIGSTIWATANLSVSQFRNGDAIPEAKTKEEWNDAVENEKPAWCYYENDPANEKSYGKLYNLFAVTDTRGLAPEGWHIATVEDWTALIDNLGGTMAATNAIKVTNGWNGTGNGSNASGFAATPNGQRANGKLFQYLGTTASWWSSSKGSYLALTDTLSWLQAYKKMGLAVRCVRDGSQQSASRVEIGNRIWATTNLNVSSFRNGQQIPEVKSKEEWWKATYERTPAWCYYEFDPANEKKYGKLYNYYALADPRGLVPDGWKMPEYAELLALTGQNILKRVSMTEGSPIPGGNKLKSTTGWSDNGNGSNTSGFNALPGGKCDESGQFASAGQIGYWWSSSENLVDRVSAFTLDRDGMAGESYTSKGCGLSIRLLKIK